VHVSTQHDRDKKQPDEQRHLRDSTNPPRHTFSSRTGGSQGRQGMSRRCENVPARSAQPLDEECARSIVEATAWNGRETRLPKRKRFLTTLLVLPKRRRLMGILQHRLRNRTSVLFLVALLLVPVAVSGHNHTGRSAHPCSICAVARHTPSVSTAPPTLLLTRFTSLIAVPRPPAAPARTDQSPPTGRAPPTLFSVVA
jgi:hypothetical protein